MTEKQITSEETYKIMREVFDYYIELYQMGKMDFKDFSIIENIWIKLELRFKEVL